jgi:hypothetical protein
MTSPAHTTGPTCGEWLGRGSVSYPCRLPREHRGRPLHDPEPCFADEVQSSVTEWRRWQERQPAPSLALHGCGGTLRLAQDRTQVECTGCDYTVQVFRDEATAKTVSGQPVEEQFSASLSSSARAATTRAGLDHVIPVESLRQPEQKPQGRQPDRSLSDLSRQLGRLQGTLDFVILANRGQLDLDVVRRTAEQTLDDLRGQS